jgi:hypothetical protein
MRRRSKSRSSWILSEPYADHETKARVVRRSSPNGSFSGWGGNVAMMTRRIWQPNVSFRQVTWSQQCRRPSCTRLSHATLAACFAPLSHLHQEPEARGLRDRASAVRRRRALLVVFVGQRRSAIRRVGAELWQNGAKARTCSRRYESTFESGGGQFEMRQIVSVALVQIPCSWPIYRDFVEKQGDSHLQLPPIRTIDA